MSSTDSALDFAALPGSLIIVAAPSGAGKTTLVTQLLAADDAISLSISHTTRAPRPGEQHGRDYHFVGHAEFQTLVAQSAFLEYAEVHGNTYGTRRDGVLRTLAAGRDVLLEIDWQGAQQVKQQLPFAQSLFILPPSLDALLQRLQRRGTDSSEVIAKRLAGARAEIAHCTAFDFLLVNDNLADALRALQGVVAAIRLQQRPQFARHRDLVAKLLA